MPAEGRRRQGVTRLLPAVELASYSGRTRRARRLKYLQPVSRLWSLLRRHGLDALIVIAVLESALAVVLAGHSGVEPRTSDWFAAPAAALIPIPLLARRRFPFAGPAFVWLLGAAISLVDGRIVTFNAATFASGLAAALLLGNLADSMQARLGLAVAVGAAAIVVYGEPGHTAGEFIFIPALVAIALACRLRAARALGAGRGRGRSRATRGARTRDDGANRRRRGARADRARAARRGRSRHERDGVAGRRGSSPLARSARGGQGRAQGRRAGRTDGARRDASPARGAQA